MSIQALSVDIGKILVFLLVLLSVFLLTAKAQRKAPNYWFAAFLLVTAIDLIGLFLLQIPYGWVNALKISSVLLQMPLYWLYVQYACYHNYRLQPAQLLHALPFVVFVSWFLGSDFSETSGRWFEALVNLQYYAYILAVLYTLRAFKRRAQEHYAGNHQLVYRWLLQTTLLFLAGNTLVQIRTLVGNTSYAAAFSVLQLATSVFALVVICWFVLKALNQPLLFQGVDIHLSPSPSREETTAPPESLRVLNTYMDTEKPYLDPELTLQKLAGQVNMTEKEVSQLINQHSGKHFFDYINDYRISLAKGLLRDKKELTVLEILYEVGFNSKSSFYTAFKKVAGTTPTAFRKSGS
ncbi:MAG: helix-turn-helix domain-containing protein [Bacteroidota bacterium]